MNPVPRPMVYVAGVALAGVCVLGLYLGIQPALERASDANQAAASSTAPTPGMAAAVQAVPLKTELPPPSSEPASSAPTQLAQVSKKKSSDADESPSSDASAAATGPQAGRSPPPDPPTLYSPDEAPAPPPAGGNGANTPPY